MGVIQIINLSTLTDHAALYRVGSYIAGDLEFSVKDQEGNVIVQIEKAGENKYRVKDVV